jgi:hypothetical protein
MRMICFVALAASAAGLSGCAPRLVQDYTVRQSELFFVVQHGKRYDLGECKRAPDGQLSDCKVHQVEFR